MSYKQESIKVKIKGRVYWFLQDSYGEGPVAYRHHCDRKGRLRPTFDGIIEGSFAHVYDDRMVKRFGQVIGKIDNFIIIT